MSEQVIAEIRAWHRKRSFAMEQRKRSDLALGSYIRSSMGWSRSLPKFQRKLEVWPLLQCPSGPKYICQTN